MKLSLLSVTFVSLTFSASMFFAADNASIQDHLKAAVDSLIQKLPPKVADEIRADSNATLGSSLGKPGFMQVANGLKIDAIPQWGLNTKDMVVNCVVAMANSRLKNQAFDLLGYLESVASSFGVLANPPYEYALDQLPTAYRVTHVLFQVSLNGEIATLYVATDFKSKRVLVNQVHGKWREPTSTERNRIVVQQRAVRLDAPDE
ncbi:MAG: hypothetical protein ABL921_34980 [Pirellula sp.]